MVFAPAGTIASLACGRPGIRLTAIYQGYTIPPYYDSLIAADCPCAHRRRRLLYAQSINRISDCGVETSIDFHLAILRDQDFIAGNYTIGYLGLKTENFLDRIIPGRRER